MIARILRPLTAATMVILSACSAGSDSTGLDDDTDIDPPADREGPTVVIQSPANGATIDGDLVVSGTASDASGVQSVTVQVNGGSPQAATGTTSWSYAVPVAQSGTYAIVVRATDVRGNASRDANLAVTIPPGWRTMGSVEISGTGTLSIGSVRVGASETDLAIFYEYTRSSLAPLDQGE